MRVRRRLAAHGIDRALLLLLPAIAFVVVIFLYPFGYGLVLSFEPERYVGAFGNYQQFFADPFLRDTIAITLGLAVPASLFNVIASVPIAYRMRGAFRGKRLLIGLLVMPITLGTVLIAKGLLTLLGARGWVNRALLDLGLVDDPVRFVNNYWGVLLTLVITGFPFAFLLTLAYLGGIDPMLERAAATLGAGPRQRFWRITFPLLLPGLAITFILTFVLAFAVFPSAVLVGEPAGKTRVISIVAYRAAYEQFDASMASAIAMIMGAVQLAVVVIVLGVRSRLYRGPSGGGKG
ncbi:MAG TPA: sugar ABC transporter permease [Solirubrobacteraceae bacterium]|jgi:putative spermidine/putrescine transport system permease protein